MSDEREAWKCLFAENLYKYIETPVFLVNSVRIGYDSIIDTYTSHLIFCTGTRYVYTYTFNTYTR